MVAQLAGFARGWSGVGLEIADHLVAALNAGFAPRVRTVGIARPVRPRAARRPRVRARRRGRVRRGACPPRTAAVAPAPQGEPRVRQLERVHARLDGACAAPRVGAARSLRRGCGAHVRGHARQRAGARPRGRRGPSAARVEGDDRADAGAARRRRAADGRAAPAPAGPADDAHRPADARRCPHGARACPRDRRDRARLVARQPGDRARRACHLQRQLRLGALRDHARLRPAGARARADRLVRAREQAGVLGVQRTADGPARGRRRERGRARDHGLRCERRGCRGTAAGTSDDARALDDEHGRGHRGQGHPDDARRAAARGDEPARQLRRCRRAGVRGAGGRPAQARAGSRSRARDGVYALVREHVPFCRAGEAPTGDLGELERALAARP